MSQTVAYAAWFDCDFGAGESWHGFYRITSKRGPVVYITLSAPISDGVAVAVGDEAAVKPPPDDDDDDSAGADDETVFGDDPHSAKVFAVPPPGATVPTVYESEGEQFGTRTGFKKNMTITVDHGDGKFEGRGPTTLGFS